MTPGDLVRPSSRRTVAVSLTRLPHLSPVIANVFHKQLGIVIATITRSPTTSEIAALGNVDREECMVLFGETFGWNVAECFELVE